MPKLMGFVKPNDVLDIVLGPNALFERRCELLQLTPCLCSLNSQADYHQDLSKMQISFYLEHHYD